MPPVLANIIRRFHKRKNFRMYLGGVCKINRFGRFSREASCVYMYPPSLSLNAYKPNVDVLDLKNNHEKSRRQSLIVLFLFHQKTENNFMKSKGCVNRRRRFFEPDMSELLEAFARKGTSFGKVFDLRVS